MLTHWKPSCAPHLVLSVCRSPSHGDERRTTSPKTSFFIFVQQQQTPTRRVPSKWRTRSGDFCIWSGDSGFRVDFGKNHGAVYGE